MKEVTSIGHIKAYKNPGSGGYKWIVIIEDVAFSYKEEKGGEIQFSNITTDIEIEYPNMNVDFTATNRITDFTQYSMIADDNIMVYGQHVIVGGSTYAGNKIDIGSSGIQGSNVAFIADNSNTSSNINVICGGNTGGGTISVGGNSSYQSSVQFSASNIWCTNITTRKSTDATDAGAVIAIDESCKSYIKDDFTLEAENSTAIVNGEYYGYMYDGAVAAAGHGASSALIVNGKNSRMSIGASKLMIGGYAYVDLLSGASQVQYMTGEALSLKGSQEVYLIPSEFLGVGYNGTIMNPTSEAALTRLNNAIAQDSSIKVCEVPSTYFAKARGYLNETPYLEKHVNGMVYFYWNFNSKENAANYIRDVVAGADSALLSKLKEYNEQMFNNSSVINVSTSAENIDATGIFMETEGGLPGYKVPTGASSPDVFRLSSKDLENRYDIITHLLTTLPWEAGNGNARYYVTSAVTSLEQIKGISITNTDLTSNVIFDTIIDRDYLESVEYNREAKPVKYGTSDKYFAKVAVNNRDYTYVVPDGVTVGNKKISGGIIVATGDVELNHDFYGLIIAGGNIKITGGAVLTTNANLMEEFIMGKEEYYDNTVTPEGYEFRHYFKAYKSSATQDDSREEVKIENVDYKDFVNFNNWRKYEDVLFPKEN